ncbi:hypothetical protein A2960_02220 [Candidatus Gottesmanbacteria bacterium RIFCSPLOWO2_01_FULL_39_12b]|uniref:Nucleotidyl transferase AbiEii/AbiGii toxin family protein n=1 Tax=Candidatus Gottesmanbacteria bacterium RIFCSPLOWO2_01_FULL_39_12b TaxID=1798388 RepID=A0A1F6AQH4_9BACT|nr:MAG: hypothetical protein A2960_02220 [Candidatus Gottesmanbacteria bacterium RIFCSPLOWO2_01_FULL_39_12b]
MDGLKENQLIRSNFYFTGGTALSEFYLQHRYSEDLDFFSENIFDHQLILSMMNNLKRKYKFRFESESVEQVYMFYLEFQSGIQIKVDFNTYPYKRLKKGSLINGIYVDSLLDIAVNKLLTITQRNDIKDFVDFYYLEPKFGIWDLIEGVSVKFQMELEPWFLPTDFLKIEDFPALPKMIKPLKLSDLKTYFRARAKELGAKVTAK